MIQLNICNDKDKVTEQMYAKDWGLLYQQIEKYYKILYIGDLQRKDCFEVIWYYNREMCTIKAKSETFSLEIQTGRNIMLKSVTMCCADGEMRTVIAKRHLMDKKDIAELLISYVMCWNLV